jgi:hypothetical protein
MSKTIRRNKFEDNADFYRKRDKVNRRKNEQKDKIDKKRVFLTEKESD